MSTKIRHWQDSVNLVAGLWMLASPWALAHQDETRPMWNAVVLGILVAATSVWALFKPRAWQEWANVAFGAWLVVSPWVLGFSSLFAVALNAMIVGGAVLLLALWALAADKKIGGRWSPVH